MERKECAINVASVVLMAVAALGFWRGQSETPVIIPPPLPLADGREVVSLNCGFNGNMDWWECGVERPGQARIRELDLALSKIELEVDCSSSNKRVLWLVNATQPILAYRTHIGKVFQIDVNRQDLDRVFRIAPSPEALGILCDDPQRVTLAATFFNQDHDPTATLLATTTIPHLQFTFPY